MSRVDEALKRSGRTDALPGDRDRRAAGDVRPPALDGSILERFAVEAPVEPSAPAPAPVPAAPRARTARPVAFDTLKASLNSKLVVSPDATPVSIEQYGRLAGTLHDLQLQQGFKTLMVASALPREGKSLTIANLALTFSEAFHRRVLLIDADLRRPSLHELFGFPNDAGLADVLRSDSASLPLVQLTPCLSVLGAGRPGSSPLAQLTSDRMLAVMREAVARFDWVCLDTPPVTLLPDARLVARLCERVVLVVAAGDTPYGLVQRSVDELGADRIVGVVLNRIKSWKAPVANAYAQSYYRSSPVRTGDR